MFNILFNPISFKNFFNKLIMPLTLVFILTFSLGIFIVFFISPDDYQQKETVKIMYIHVPSAWLALMIFSIMTIYSIIALTFKMPFGFIVNSALAPIGASFTLICIVTGSLWGKPMWGTWWVWDARLTSVLILFLIYLIIIMFKRSFSNTEVGEKITAIFIIISSINIPIIKFSVDWWNTLHQPASISKLSSPSIDSSMLWPLIIMTLSFFLLAFILSIIRVQSEIHDRKKRIF